MSFSRATVYKINLVKIAVNKIVYGFLYAGDFGDVNFWNAEQKNPIIWKMNTLVAWSPSVRDLVGRVASFVFYQVHAISREDETRTVLLRPSPAGALTSTGTEGRREWMKEVLPVHLPHARPSHKASHLRAMSHSEIPRGTVRPTWLQKSFLLPLPELWTRSQAPVPGRIPVSLQRIWKHSHVRINP